MDFIELIGNLVEFAQNDDEFPDEVNNLMATLKSLQGIMESTHHQLPQHIIQLLDDDLPDAKSLIEKVRKKSNSFWNRVMNLFPWSDLNKIKEKNVKLLKIINILNLHLSSRQKFRRSTTAAPQQARESSDPGPTKRLKTMSSGETQGRELSSSTAATDADSYRRVNTIDHQRSLSISSFKDNEEELPHDGELAFRLKLVCDPNFADSIKGMPETQSIMKRFWNDQGKAVLSFRRMNLANDFKALEAQRLSKEHAKITSSRSLLLNNNNPLPPPPQEQDSNNNSNSNNNNNSNGNGSQAQNGAMEIEVPKKDENANNNSGADITEGKMIEEPPRPEKPKNQYEYSFRLKDTSLNGTYYLKGFNLEGESGIGAHITGDFQRLKKNDEVTLEHGDIIGLILEKPHFQRLTFGYQFLTE